MAATEERLLFDRRCRLIIFGPRKVETIAQKSVETQEVIEIDGGAVDDREKVGMHIRFNVKKNLKKEPNTGEITVSNLSPTRRASLQGKGVQVILEAGYKGTGMFRVVSGDVRTVDHVREGANWNTIMKLGDGERSWGFARFNKSFSRNTSVATVVREIGQAMKLDPGNLDQQASKIGGKFDHGFNFTGYASAALEKALRSVGLTWSVQDGKLQILGVDEIIAGTPEEITSTSGLVGSPEMGSPQKKGGPPLVKFKSLLMPMTPGNSVKLKSERYDGRVRVVACEFRGDTQGGEWYTEISAEVLK